MKNLSIPITDHNTGGICTLSYDARYKTGSGGWVNVERQYDSPVLINGLADTTEYDIEVIRNCCSGLSSVAATFTINTAGLITPENFTATPGNTEIDLAWDVDPIAENYILQRATDAGFTTDLVTVYTGFPITNPAAVNDPGLLNGTTYYYRLKSQASGYPDSDYAFASATPAP